MPRHDPIADQLFELDEHMRPLVEKGLMKPLSAQELKNLYQQRVQSLQGPGGGLATIPSGINLPIAGFQGSTMFNNQAGTSPMIPPALQMGQRTANPSMFEKLDAYGQPMGPPTQTQGWFPGPRDPFLMAQGGQPAQPLGGGGRGFNTTIQIGEDGQVSGINLKRAMQKRFRGQNG